MGLKARVLVPAGALAATLLATACVPPPVDPGTTTTTGATTPTTPTTTGSSVPPPPTCPNVNDDATPGPNSQNPKSSWGVNGAGYAAVIIDDVVYVGGTFSQAVSPNGGQTQPRANLAAFCLANGGLLSTFVANTNGQVWALTTDGTSLFAGGNFTTVNGEAVEPASQAEPRNRRGRHHLQSPRDPRRRLRAGLPVGQRQHLRRWRLRRRRHQGQEGGQLPQGHRCRHRLEPERRQRIESLEISPDSPRCSSAAASTTSADRLTTHSPKPTRSSGAVDAANCLQPRQHAGSGLIQGRIFSIAVGGPTQRTLPSWPSRPAKPASGRAGGNKFASTTRRPAMRHVGAERP